MSKNNLAGLLKQSKQKGYEQGLADGQIIMLHIVEASMHELFGFGNSNPDKWKQLEDHVDEWVAHISDKIRQGDAELGFEHLVDAMRKARGDEIGDKIDAMYKDVVYNFKED